MARKDRMTLREQFKRADRMAERFVKKYQSLLPGGQLLCFVTPLSEGYFLASIGWKKKIDKKKWYGNRIELAEWPLKDAFARELVSLLNENMTRSMSRLRE